ncbi:MAG: hypothetical protein ACOCR6_03535, partial [archaeon]
QSITDTARALARELNVGIIGVETAHDATLVEPARVTGAGDFSTTIDAIRFQATTHHLTEGSFPVNHPKNYLGYVLALTADDNTRDIYADKVINSVSGGRRGAILLGLVDDRPDGETLTHLGAEVVRFARTRYGSLSAALDQFDAWTGRSTRFTELAPRWAQLARSIAIQYDPTQLIIEALERLHQTGTDNATIADVAAEACRINQPLAVEVFFTQNRRDDVLTADGDINDTMLHDPTVYKSGIHFQYKYQLYHVGLLTTGGTDEKDKVLDNLWQLEQPTHLFNQVLRVQKSQLDPTYFAHIDESLEDGPPANTSNTPISALSVRHSLRQSTFSASEVTIAADRVRRRTSSCDCRSNGRRT